MLNQPDDLGIRVGGFIHEHHISIRHIDLANVRSVRHQDILNSVLHGTSPFALFSV
nr:MAG TPA: hypothetical protein [Caudoviricetes sp.]